MSTQFRARRPATSTDVARLAGVSRSTVSNILNGNDARFPEQTRRRVRDAAQALDYQPSIAGRSLVSGRSDTIVVLVANVTFATRFQDAVDRVVTSTRSIGHNVVIRLASESPRATSRAVSLLRPLAVVDFGVLAPQERAWLEQRGTIILPTADPAASADPDGGIARLQASALLEHRPRSLWFAALAGNERDPFAPMRVQALRSVCADAGLPPPRSIDVDLTIESGTRAVREIVALPSPAGVACYNDDVAMSLLAGAAELGVAVPEALAVAGVDYSPIGQLWRPRLTTIDTDLRGLVDAITAQLRVRLGETGLEAPDFVTHFELVRGETA